MMFVSSRTFGMKRAGNSVSLRPAPLAKVSPSPKVTKRFFQATIFPEPSTAAFRKWKPAGR
jgi:hypothetical protein